MTIENDDLFSDDSPVLVWYPPPGVENDDRTAWAWLPGWILSQCGSDEWHVVVEALALAEPDPRAPDGDAPENLLYPACFRDSSEIRAVSVGEWQRVGTVWMTDRLIRVTTTLAVITVAAVAAVISYRHAYELVRSHGESGMTARLAPFTVDGLIWVPGRRWRWSTHSSWP